MQWETFFCNEFKGEWDGGVAYMEKEGAIFSTKYRNMEHHMEGSDRNFLKLVLVPTLT